MKFVLSVRSSRPQGAVDKTKNTASSRFVWGHFELVVSGSADGVKGRRLTLIYQYLPGQEGTAGTGGRE